ncbi:MAG: copper amine oxidase N-terminal domain-containing protein [Defluviitaleaceae bacterium]|nr:copper amine oxidase N-terminal domain-containing protein [Defluviitaleaceae bacterium]
MKKSVVILIVIFLILLTGCVSEANGNHILNGAETISNDVDAISCDEEVALDNTEADAIDDLNGLYVQSTQIPRVRINWEPIEIPYDNQQPITVNNHTFIPLHTVMGALGFLVEWEEQTQTATLICQWHTVIIQMGSYYTSINNNIRSLDVPAMIVNSHPMISICAISVISRDIGNEIQWDERIHTVDIFVYRDMTIEQLRERPRTISPPIQTSIGGIELRMHPEELVSLLDANGIDIIVLMEHQDWKTIYAHVENPIKDGRIYNIYSEFSFFFKTEDFTIDYSEDEIMEFMHVSSMQHRTFADIGIGDNRNSVIEAHGDTYAISPYSSSTIEYFDGENYLFFFFDFHENVEGWGIGQISIFELQARRYIL